MAIEWTTTKLPPDYTETRDEWEDDHGNTNDGPALFIGSDGRGAIVEGESRADLVTWLRRAADRIEGRRPAEAFKLDEERAREWLTAVVAYNEQGDELPDEFEDFDPGITSDWSPRDEDADASVWHDLPYSAKEVRAITGPQELYLWVEPDYYYRVAFQPVPLGHYVASMAEKLRHIGDRDARGVDAAIAVLRDMVDEGNRLAKSTGLTAAPEQADAR